MNFGWMVTVLSIINKRINCVYIGSYDIAFPIKTINVEWILYWFKNISFNYFNCSKLIIHRKLLVSFLKDKLQEMN